MTAAKKRPAAAKANMFETRQSIIPPSLRPAKPLDTSKIVEAAEPVEKKRGKNYVEGWRVVTFLVPVEALKQLKFMSVETERPIMAMMREALDDFFQKYGKNRIAGSAADPRP